MSDNKPEIIEPQHPQAPVLHLHTGPTPSKTPLHVGLMRGLFTNALIQAFMACSGLGWFITWLAKIYLTSQGLTIGAAQQPEPPAVVKEEPKLDPRIDEMQAKFELLDTERQAAVERMESERQAAAKAAQDAASREQRQIAEVERLKRLMEAADAATTKKLKDAAVAKEREEQRERERKNSLIPLEIRHPNRSDPKCPSRIELRPGGGYQCYNCGLKIASP